MPIDYAVIVISLLNHPVVSKSCCSMYVRRTWPNKKDWYARIRVKILFPIPPVNVFFFFYSCCGMRPGPLVLGPQAGSFHQLQMIGEGVEH
jgi:hypothetical protein